MVSACSSGMEILNSFSNSMINSTVSRESAPKSLVKEASLVTSASSTPSLSTMIFLTLVAMSDIFVKFSYGCKNIDFGIITINRWFLIIAVDILLFGAFVVLSANGEGIGDTRYEIWDMGCGMDRGYTMWGMGYKDIA